ncbi:MAG: Wzz/FepE/Etk N-terminal domain-containing protein [Candidatus Latescibacterota bacterium]|nr:Wzz/FepE/Etk N-terminal domain-containing protein [Candidatus Latescibacterota bacterium]
MPNESGLLDHIAVIVRWRRMILAAVIMVSVATAGISLVLPEAYRAHALVYPPNQGSDTLGLSGLVGELPLGLLGLGEGGASATDFVPVLQSERVAEAVAERFNLMDVYKVTTREELLMAVGARLEVKLSREQFLAVSYEASTPQAAADQTNAFVEELDRALRERKREQASSLRRYFESRLSKAGSDVANSELAYNHFQKENMAIDLETQAKAQIETAGTLVATLAEQIIKKEVAERVMEPDNPKLGLLAIEVDATRKAVDRMLMGTDATDTISELPEIIIPFRDVPDLGLSALQFMRDLEIQNAIYKFVRQEYEKSKLEEDKEIAQVIPLDKAFPPDSRSKPARTMMVILAAGLSLVVSILLAYVFEAFTNLDPADQDKLAEIRRELRGS